MFRNAKPKFDASTGAHDCPTMSKTDLYGSLFELPSLSQIGNHGDARPAAVAPARWGGTAK
jgi:hypothetical protein